MNRRQRDRKHARRSAHSPSGQRPRYILSRDTYPAVRRAHIVPRTYQRNFAINQQVAVHVVDRPGHVTMHIDKAGTRKHFYRRLRPDLSEIDDTEASLGEMENVAGPALRDVVRGMELTVKRKNILAQFVGLQMLRGPEFFTQHHANAALAVPETIHRKDVAAALLASVGGNLDSVRDHIIDVFRQPTEAHLTMLASSLKVASILGHMRWQLLRFGEPLLAFSDQPIVVWPADVEIFHTPPRRPQFAPLAALEIRVPLSPDLAVLMSWADEPDTRHSVAVDPAYAAEMNAMVIGQRDKQWMHQPGNVPPVATGSLRPISSRLDPTYSWSTALRSKRLITAERSFDRTRKRRYIDEVEVLLLDEPHAGDPARPKQQ